MFDRTAFPRAIDSDSALTQYNTPWRPSSLVDGRLHRVHRDLHDVVCELEPTGVLIELLQHINNDKNLPY